MEEIEMTQFLESVQRNEFSDEFGTDQDEDSLGDDTLGEAIGDIPFSAKAAQAALTRKYRNLRVALEKDPMVFVDEIFEVSPTEGQVWSNSELEVTVSFRPDTAALFTCIAYLDISGREDRLQLNLNGQGIGPHASLSYDVLDTGDVFINDDQHYEVRLLNKGDINAKWTFLSSLTRFGSKFTFTPSEGMLKPGESQLIKIDFSSDILGEFSEHFRFSLQGNEDMLLFQVKGHVIGPTFHLDCNSIDFGVVSYDYLHTTTTRLVNSSKIPMMFYIHVPQDGSYLKQEFDISPNEGVLVPGEFIDITIDFIPQQVKVYEYSLAVDVLGVGEMLLSTPITAECIVEQVQIAKREVTYGDCFLKYPYVEDFVLINPSQSVRTKFDIQPQLAASKALASFEPDPATGFIEPGESMAVKVRLIPEKLGPSKVPITLTVAGSLEPPMQAALVFNCVGPRVLLDQREIKWGNVECLHDEKRTLQITNDSLIPAELHFFLKTTRSRFDVPMREAVLEPQETLALELNANVDDTIVHKEELHVMITNSDNLMIPLSARGTGTTMYCKEDIQVIDFGPQLTGIRFERRITLENKGKRPQQLRWYNETVRDENLQRLSKVKAMKQAPSTLPKHLAPTDSIFSVHPAEVTLRPRTATTFIFKGMSHTPGPVSEVFVLESKVGKDRNMIPILRTETAAEIQNPLLEFSVREIILSYTWELNVAPAVIKKELVLTNKTAVPLGCILKTEAPFNLTSFDVVLEPEETVVIGVEFDPLYRDDKTSLIIEKAITVSYRGHTQHDSIKVIGEVNFPNLKFENTTINFGCILNETEKKIKCSVTNCSKVVCSYNWIFMENDLPNKPVKGKKKLDLGGPLPVSIPPNQSFDIMPIRSVLHPGESEDVEFVLYGSSNAKFNCFAICEVEGGPEYKLSLLGESSTVAYSLDCSHLDFGEVVYTENVTKEFTIYNNGRVPFNFRIGSEFFSSPGLIEFAPMRGQVASNDKCVVKATFKPGVPLTFAEKVIINVAHFDPAIITCYATGIFPVATVTLPRNRGRYGPYGEKGEKEVVQNAWEVFTQTARDRIMSPNLLLYPPISELAQAPPSATSAEPVVFETPRVELVDEGAMDDNLSVGVGSQASNLKPKQEALDVEMTRMVFAHLLTNAIKVGRDELTAADATAASPVLTKEELSNQEVMARAVDVQSLVSATYACDFGNVLAGTSKKKVFKITNASNAGVMSWSFDNALAARDGFNIDPDSVQKLPEGAAQEFTVRFSTRNQKPGHKKHILNIIIKGTGSIQIILRANICTPEIELSTESLNFDRVYVGCSKKMYFRLHNPTPVKANWSLRGAAGSRDESKFVFTPAAGTLRSGKKLIVSCEFMPSEGRKHQLDVVLKIDMNNKQKTIIVEAEALPTPIRFEPSFIETGPILPFSAGDEKVVTVTSNCEIPVELYSLDFDEQYKEEESMVSLLSDMFENDGYCRVPIREAGAPMQSLLTDAYAVKTAPPPEPTVDENGEIIEEPEKISLPLPPLRNVPGPRDEGKHQDIIVVTPPVCGCSSIAAYLSKKLVLPTLSVDAIIDEIVQLEGECSFRARRATKRLTEDEQATIADKEATLSAAAESSKEVAIAAYKAANKKATSVPDEVLETPEALEYLKFIAESEANADFFAAMITHRLSWEDAGYGAIVDGVVSLYADEGEVIKGLKQALPEAIVCSISLEGGSEEAFTNRISVLYDTNVLEEARLDKALQTARAKLLVPKKGKKKAKKKSDSFNMSTEPSIDIENYVFPKMLPEGDETWLDASGNVLELDAQDIRSLDDEQRVLYTAQLRWAQQKRLEQTKEVIRSILAIWSPETGLKTSLESDVAETVMEDDVEGENTGEGSSSEEIPPVKEFEGKGEETATSKVGANGNGDNAEVVTEEIPNGDVNEDEVPKGPIGPIKKVILFNKFMNEILPLVNEVFADPPSTDETVEEGEETEKKPEESNSAAPATESSADVALEGEPGEEKVGEDVPAVKPKETGVFEVSVAEGDDLDTVTQATLALIPTAKVPPFDKDAIPPTVEFQLIRMPYPRFERKPVRNFDILEYTPERAEDEASLEAEAVDANEKVDVMKKPYRWIIPPFGQVKFKVRFTSNVEGKFESAAMFEVMGSKQEFSLFCSGRCEVPKISGDSRMVFTKRAKTITPNAPLPSKRFVMSKNCFSFGPILAFKQSDWRHAPAEDADATVIDNHALVFNTNSEIFRLTNVGNYQCQVSSICLLLTYIDIDRLLDDMIALFPGGFGYATD